MASKSRCKGPGDCKKPKSIVGHCSHCELDYCLTHRLPEAHECANLTDCRQSAFDENKARLESERTVAPKITA